MNSVTCSFEGVIDKKEVVKEVDEVELLVLRRDLSGLKGVKEE